MIDWIAIRSDYESGEFSQSDLERNHGVSRKAISNHARDEHWVTPQVTSRKSQVTPVTKPPIQYLPIPDDAATIARIGLHQLAQHLQAEEILPISSHKSLSDALAQYVKVLIVAPREVEAQDVLSIPLNKLSPRTRIAIQRLLDEDEQEKVS